MYIAEIIYPGTWLELPDKDISFEVQGMLRHLQDRIVEAAVSLSMFEECQVERSDPREEWERDTQIRREIEHQLRLEVGENYYRNFDTYRLEAQRRSLRRKAELGIVPRAYRHKTPFIHAHSFVYAVDSFGKFLDELCDYDCIPEEVRTAREEFNARLPMVQKIRNSALHVEDRSRRYASPQDKRKGKRMEVDGFLGLSNLEGNQLCYTIADGSYQRITISPESINIMVVTLNRLLAALPWTGPPDIAPR